MDSVGATLDALFEFINDEGLELIDPVLLELLLDDLQCLAVRAFRSETDNSGPNSGIETGVWLKERKIRLFIEKTALKFNDYVQAENAKILTLKRSADWDENCAETYGDISTGSENNNATANGRNGQSSALCQGDMWRRLYDSSDDVVCLLFRLLQCVSTSSHWFNDLMFDGDGHSLSQTAQCVLTLCQHANTRSLSSVAIARFLLTCYRHRAGHTWLKEGDIFSLFLRKHMSNPDARCRHEIDRCLSDAITSHLTPPASSCSEYARCAVDKGVSLVEQFLPFLVVLPRSHLSSVTLSQDPPWLMCSRVLQRAIRQYLCSAVDSVSESVLQQWQAVVGSVATLCRRRPALLASPLSQLRLYLALLSYTADTAFSLRPSLVTAFREACECAAEGADFVDALRRLVELALDVVLVLLHMRVTADIDRCCGELAAVCLAPLVSLLLRSDICCRQSEPPAVENQMSTALSEQTKQFLTAQLSLAKDWIVTTYPDLSVDSTDSDKRVVALITNNELLNQNGCQLMNKMATIFGGRFEAKSPFCSNSALRNSRSGRFECSGDDIRIDDKQLFAFNTARVWIHTLQQQLANIPASTANAVLALISRLLDHVCRPLSESLETVSGSLTSPLVVLITNILHSAIAEGDNTASRERTVMAALKCLTSSTRWLITSPPPSNLPIDSLSTITENTWSRATWTQLSGCLVVLLDGGIPVDNCDDIIDSIGDLLTALLSALVESRPSGELRCGLGADQSGRLWLIDWLNESQLVGRCLAALLQRPGVTTAVSASSAHRHTAIHLLAAVTDLKTGADSLHAASGFLRCVWPSICVHVRPLPVISDAVRSNYVADALDVSLLCAVLTVQYLKESETSGADNMDVFAAENIRLIRMALLCDEKLIVDSARWCSVLLVLCSVKYLSTSRVIQSTVEWLGSGVADAVTAMCECISSSNKTPMSSWQKTMCLEALDKLMALVESLPENAVEQASKYAVNNEDAVRMENNSSFTGELTDRDSIVEQVYAEDIGQLLQRVSDVDNDATVVDYGAAVSICADQLLKRARAVLFPNEAPANTENAADQEERSVQQGAGDDVTDREGHQLFRDIRSRADDIMRCAHMNTRLSVPTDCY